jgi:LysM repeat protein
VVLSLSVVIAGGYAMNAKAGSDSQVNPEVQSYVTVVVAPGETLWSIASKFSDGDARSLVDQVITINSLSGGDVEAGQKIRIPLYK